MMNFLTKLCLVGAAVLFAAWLVLKNKGRIARAADEISAIPFRRIALFLVFVAVAAIYGGAKNGTNAPPQGASPPPLMMVATPAPAPLFSSASVTTNGTWDFSAPPGATVHERWRLRGAADDWFPLFPAGWSFALGDTSVTNLRVFSRGKSRLPDGTEISPLPATLGVVPEMNWQLLGSNSPSLFWHSLSSDGSLLLTWQNVLLHRAATNPVSVQAELRPSGGVTFRYDLSRLASDDPLSDVAPAAGGVSPDVPLSRGVTSVSLKSRDEAICDAARTAFAESLGGLDPLSFPEGSTNTVLEHLFYSGTTNGAFFYPLTNDSTAVLRVAVTGFGSGDLLVGGSYVPLVAPPQMRGGTPQGNPLMFPVSKGGTVPVYLRGDGTLSVSFDSGEFAFGELPSLSANRCVGWINFPETRATEPCVHDLRTRRRTVSLPASSGADDLVCTWNGAANVGVENIPPRSARITASFDARETRGITYALSHPKRLFGQTEYAQTVRFCPRPPDPDPDEQEPEPPWYSGDDHDDEDEEEEDPQGLLDDPEPGEPGDGDGDADEVCPVHDVPYEQCAHLHEDDYTNAVQNVAHMAGVLYVRDPPVVGDQVYLEVPNGHVNCCGCPDHWTNCVSLAYKSYRLRVTGPDGLPFSSTGESCTVDVAGVHPSEAVGDAGLAFARNGEVYERRGYTALGVAIQHDGIPLSRYNALNPLFGFPMTVCTNDWRAPTLNLVTNVRLPSGTVHLEFAGATAPFALWYVRRGESVYRKLLDSETCPAKDIPIAAWRSVVAGVTSDSSASVPVLLTSSAPGTVRLVLRYWTAAGGAFVEDSASQRITSVNPMMMPDVDGDRSLGDGDVAGHLAGRVFRFWTNEDVHKGDYVGQSSDIAPNASDLVVNGRLDLVNLFPVKLDLKPLVDAWGNGVRFMLWSPQGSSLRFCGLDSQPSGAWAFQTNDVYTTGGDPVHSADLIPVGGEGVEIDPADYLGFGNSPGVLAFEAVGEVVRPDALTLLVVDGEDDTLFSCSIPLSLRSVHDMYSWIGARHLSGEADYRSTAVHRMWEGETVKSLVFFHGFNVTGSGAQEWADAVFKRLWLSGAKMEFYNVDWRGDIGSDANYHQNASNAFVVASQLASTIAAIPGEKVVMAHSLGNMAAASMIQDHGLQVSRFLMCDSAVPSEAYYPANDVSIRIPQLVHPQWEEYPTNSWASNWHKLFAGDVYDDRRKLGWPGRFSNVAQYAVNFYSTGDEVLELLDDNDIGILTGVTSGYVQYSWHHQELWKGRGVANMLGGTTWSGWNIEENLFGVDKISVPEAQQMSPEDFKTNTVFYCYPSSMNSTNISLLVRAAHLTQGIPALARPTGGTNLINVVSMDDAYDLNLDESSLSEEDPPTIHGLERPNGWPLRSSWGARWLHSDMMDISYFYNFKFYEKVIEKGSLQ